MIVIIGLLILFVAVIVGVVGVATNNGSTHSVGDQFAVLGHALTGVSTGQLFLYGIVVGVVGMLGLSMLLGTFNRRLASRGSRRELKGSRREGAQLRLDRERLTQQLDDERSEHQRLDVPGATVLPPVAVGDAPTGRPGLWRRFSHSADR